MCDICGVDVKGAAEVEGGDGQGGDDPRDEAIEVGVGRALDVERAAADVGDGVAPLTTAVGTCEDG